MFKGNGDKIELYVVSLWLLFLLIIVVTIDIPLEFGTNSNFIGFDKLLLRNVVPVISFIFVIFGLTFLLRFKYKLSGSKKSSMIVEEIKNKDYEHLTFLTTYIIPLICFNLDDVKYIIVLFILLCIIGAIYIRTDLFYANPTLALMGFRIYKVTAKFEDGSEELIIISREVIHKGDNLLYRELDETVYFVRCEND